MEESVLTKVQFENGRWMGAGGGGVVISGLSVDSRWKGHCCIYAVSLTPVTYFCADCFFYFQFFCYIFCGVLYCVKVHGT